MITIVSIDENGKVYERLYDNRTAKFYTVDKKPIIIQFKHVDKHSDDCDNNIKYDFKSLTEKEEYFKNSSSNDKEEIKYDFSSIEERDAYYARLNNRSVSSTNKVNNPRILKIQLGLSCNYSCSYCKQAVHVENAEKSNMHDVDEFIKNFDTWCTVKKNEDVRIELWGGEPLVYFAKIKRLVPFLRNRFNKARISILSNGSLLNEEICNFILDNFISFAISHDGIDQLTNRTGDPLKENSESLKWIKHYVTVSKNPLYVNMVLSKQNIDPKKNVDYIKSILGNNVLVGYEGIVVVEDEDQFDNTTMFTEEDYFDLRAKLRDDIVSGDIRNIQPFNSKFEHLLNSWANEKYLISDTDTQKCGHDSEYILAVNLKGDVLVCHSSSDIIGNVNKMDEVNLLSTGGVTLWQDREHCSKCIVLNMCRGACMNMSGNARTHTCNNEFHFNLSVFEAAYIYMFGEKIINISGDFDRPTLSNTKKITIPIKQI